MKNEEKALVKAKRIECVIGFIFLIPVILGIIAFILCLFDNNSNFATMRRLSASWTNDFSSQGGGGMSAAPIFLGMLAMTGAYLIKDSLKYLFVEKDKQEDQEKPKE